MKANSSHFFTIYDSAFSHLFSPDIDECKLNKDNCDKNANCINTPGGFKCECKPGYSGNGVKCEGVHFSELFLLECFSSFSSFISTKVLEMDVLFKKKHCNSPHAVILGTCMHIIWDVAASQIIYRANLPKVKLSCKESNKIAKTEYLGCIIPQEQAAIF